MFLVLHFGNEDRDIIGQKTKVAWLLASEYSYYIKSFQLC